MVRVIWTPAALDDLNDIRVFIDTHSPKNALEEMGRIFSAADALQEFPNLGKIASLKFTPPIRLILSGNYRIVYRIVETDVTEILSVTHGSREIDWDNRVFEPEAGYSQNELTPEEEAKVEQGLVDIKNGNIHTHEEIKKMVGNWFKNLPKEG